MLDLKEEELKTEIGGQENSQRPIGEMIDMLRADINNLEKTIEILRDRCKFYMRIEENGTDSRPKLEPIKYYNAPILNSLVGLVEKIRNLNNILEDIANRLV